MCAGVVGSGRLDVRARASGLAWRHRPRSLRLRSSTVVVVTLAAVLVASAALFVASSTYSPFIYFRF